MPVPCCFLMFQVNNIRLNNAWLVESRRNRCGCSSLDTTLPPPRYDSYVVLCDYCEVKQSCRCCRLRGCSISLLLNYPRFPYHYAMRHRFQVIRLESVGKETSMNSAVTIIVCTVSVKCLQYVLLLYANFVLPLSFCMYM